MRAARASHAPARQPPDHDYEGDPMTMHYTATFQPEAWVNDHAIQVDPEGPTQWDCTAFIDVDTLAYLDECARGSDALTGPYGALDRDDVFMNDPAAPDWVRKWRGPFTIRVQSSTIQGEV